MPLFFLSPPCQISAEKSRNIGLNSAFYLSVPLALFSTVLGRFAWL